jgi:hypothetical protein
MISSPEGCDYALLHNQGDEPLQSVNSVRFDTLDRGNCSFRTILHRRCSAGISFLPRTEQGLPKPAPPHERLSAVFAHFAAPCSLRKVAAAYSGHYYVESAQTLDSKERPGILTCSQIYQPELAFRYCPLRARF